MQKVPKLKHGCGRFHAHGFSRGPRVLLVTNYLSFCASKKIQCAANKDLVARISSSTNSGKPPHKRGYHGWKSRELVPQTVTERLAADQITSDQGAKQESSELYIRSKFGRFPSVIPRI